MITVDFSSAIAFYFLIIFCILMGGWMFLSRQKENHDMSLDPRFIWFCSVCTYTYINTKEEVISVCPRCGSYNKKSIE